MALVAEHKGLGGTMTGKIGILAYGSLIDDPGAEIQPFIFRRIDCHTPFKVEFARTSKCRSGAPTLVPYENGAQVAAQLLVVDLPLFEATDCLYRREVHKVGDKRTYVATKKVTPNSVVIKTLRDFEGIDTVLYTSIGANIEGLTAVKLATLAICSARARNDGRDGISYLINTKRAGIKTPLSDEYEAEIKRQTGAVNLEQALAAFRSKPCH